MNIGVFVNDYLGSKKSHGRMFFLDIMTTVINAVNKFFIIVRPVDFIDIILVAYIFYKAIKLVKETRAVQLVKGIVILIVATQVSHWLQFNTISFILQNTMQVGVVALLVVFQPELRRALEKMGRSNISSLFNASHDDTLKNIEEITEAVSHMSKEKIGALIVIERGTKLGEVAATGTQINSSISSSLLINIFMPNTPLHDGAVVIRDGRIKSAACILPLTQNDSLGRELGTRHRAALGVTEHSDCAVVVVSEETGKISIALEGDMTRNLTPDSLSKLLVKVLTPDQIKHKEEIKNWRDKLKWSKK